VIKYRDGNGEIARTKGGTAAETRVFDRPRFAGGPWEVDRPAPSIRGRIGRCGLARTAARTGLLSARAKVACFGRSHDLPSQGLIAERPPTQAFSAVPSSRVGGVWADDVTVAIIARHPGGSA
jgi:hypothetical protein